MIAFCFILCIGSLCRICLNNSKIIVEGSFDIVTLYYRMIFSIDPTILISRSNLGCLSSVCVLLCRIRREFDHCSVMAVSNSLEKCCVVEVIFNGFDQFSSSFFLAILAQHGCGPFSTFILFSKYLRELQGLAWTRCCDWATLNIY